MRWVKLTSPGDSGKRIWVNLDLIVEMRTGEFWETGRETTRLFSGHMGYTADLGVASVEYHAVDVIEEPDKIIRLGEADLCSRGIAA